jgi:hypothetical protein
MRTDVTGELSPTDRNGLQGIVYDCRSPQKPSEARLALRIVLYQAAEIAVGSASPVR